MPASIDERIIEASKDHPYQEGCIFSARAPFSLPTSDLSKALHAGHHGCARIPYGLIYRNINFRILKAMTPFTLSAALKVEFWDPGTRAKRVGLLKLFDRRFMLNTRTWRKMAEWNPNNERAYRDAVHRGDAEAVILKRKLDTERDACTQRNKDLTGIELYSGQHIEEIIREGKEMDDNEGWEQDPKRVETSLQFDCLDMFATELRAYELLSHLQGFSIPKLLGTVAVPRPDFPEGLNSMESSEETPGVGNDTLGSQSGEIEDVFSPFYVIPGLLIEFLENSFTLKDIPVHTPQIDWSKIVSLVNDTNYRISQSPFLNRDVRPENVLIVKSQRLPPVISPKDKALYRKLASLTKLLLSCCKALRPSRPKVNSDTIIGPGFQSQVDYTIRIIDFGVGEFRGCHDDFSWLLQKASNHNPDHIGAGLAMKIILRRDFAYELPEQWDLEGAYDLFCRLGTADSRHLMDLQRIEANTEIELVHTRPQQTRSV